MRKSKILKIFLDAKTGLETAENELSRVARCIFSFFCYVDLDWIPHLESRYRFYRGYLSALVLATMLRFGETFLYSEIAAIVPQNNVLLLSLITGAAYAALRLAFLPIDVIKTNFQVR